MRKENFIPVNTPLLRGNEKRYLNECIDSGWISSEGPFVKELEEKFSSYVHRNFGIAVTNGTAAIDAAIAALDIGPGDEVILPTFTIISCIHQILRAGARPIFVDSNAKTWNMDVTQIEPLITKNTKAIMIVHIYGLPVDVDSILEIAQKYNLKIIEDAAEMIGQTYKGAPCGSFGDISTFSFYPNKHITTGEGGMIVTNNESIAERCSSLRNLCFQKHKRFVHEELGWNLRMTNLQAAIGLAQLERLDEFVKKKKAMGCFYNRAFRNIPNIQLPRKTTSYGENIYWVYGIVLEPNNGLTAESVMERLQNEGIGTRPFFCPLHLQPVLKHMGYSYNRYPVAESLYQLGFYIPSGLGLSQKDIEHVANTVTEVLT